MKVDIDKRWRTLWSGRLRLMKGGRGIEIEWGPPIIWLPRFSLVYRDRVRGWKAGWGWFLIRYGRATPSEASE